MKLLIQGNNITVTEAIRNYVEEKLNKAVKHFTNITTKIDVHLSVSPNQRVSDRHIAEVTVHANRAVIRAQESSENLYASIDLVADKLARQLRKFKEKKLHRTHIGTKPSEGFADESLNTSPTLENLVPSLPEEVVRMKYFAMPPMTVAEAREHLQLVDHDFYVFLNSESQEINVMYQRNHGGYGVICPRRVNSADLLPQDSQTRAPEAHGREYAYTSNLANGHH
ncbi:MAG: ribosome-associated translation inhibitor RaiA [Cyanobacteria bacterium P01_H01_bin.15]